MKKTALVTGASSGIGYELAKCCAKDKYDLILIARRADKLEEIKKEFENTYKISVHILPKDLSEPLAPQEIAQEVSNVPIDILINDAGVAGYGKFNEMELTRIQDIIHVNIHSLTELTRYFLPQMVARGKGRILNVASTAAFQPGPLLAVYSASKGYILSFSEAINNELQGTGVTATALCPGSTESGFHKTSSTEKVRVNKAKMPTAAEVAAYGYKAMQAGKAVAIHGFLNKLLVFGLRLSPRSMIVKVSRWFAEIV
jgi:short-subunit dehydrogenase